ncbi:hypothetical protein QJQ45_020872 [Haematococcus lacustris]|nr:hypothetical protein QJQ45_020872 [Haematococcus lacustris]
MAKRSQVRGLMCLTSINNITRNRACNSSRLCCWALSRFSRAKEPWYKVLFHEAPGNEGVYECDACGTKDIRAGKNINHLLAHLGTRKCNFKESEAAKEMAKTDDNVKEFLEKCVKRHKPASTSEPSCSQPAASAEQGGKQTDIESLLGKWMYATGSSFRSVEVPEFKDLIHALRPDFIIPTRKKLHETYLGVQTTVLLCCMQMGGELLLNEYAATCDEVRARIDMAPYVSITCDAWSPSQGGEHILGWCVAWSGHAFMLDAVHTEDASVTALFMKEKLDLILDKHNLKGKVCALVTDTPSTMKAFWALVQAAYPKTKASGCWMHVINLSFNGNLIAIRLAPPPPPSHLPSPHLPSYWSQLSRIKVHIEEAKDLIMYARHSTAISDLLRKQRKDSGSKQKLQPPNNTRMHSLATMLDSIAANRQPLVNLALDEASPFNTLPRGTSQGQRKRVAGIKAHILDESWWAYNRFLRTAMQPLVKLQEDLQSDSANLADLGLDCWLLASLELGRGSWLLASLELGRGSWRLVSLELGRGSWLLASLELGRGSWLLASLELGRGSWLLASLELGRGSWLLASLELGKGSWLLASLELGRGCWLLASLEPGKLAAMSKLFNERVAYGETGALYATGLLDPRYRGRHTELTHSQVMMADMCIAELASADGQGTDRAAGDARFNLHQRWLMPKALQLVGLSNSVLDTVLTANPCLWWQTYGHGFGVLRDVAMRLLSIPATSASTERVFSTFKHIWSDHRQSMLMGRMWMSSYIYFNRRPLKGTRGQTRSSEEERAEFEEWLQHQPNGISEFYDRDVSAALNIRRCAVGQGPRPTELCYWTNRPAMPKPGQPGQEWVEIPDKPLLLKWQRKLQQ